MELRLVHDLLDKPVLDEGRRNIGRVDGVVLEPRRKGPPVVSSIEIGGRLLATRIHPRLGRWAQRLAKRWPAIGNGVTRIAMSDVRTTGITVAVRCDGRKMPAMGWEQWLLRNVIGRIPGA